MAQLKDKNAMLAAAVPSSNRQPFNPNSSVRPTEELMVNLPDWNELLKKDNSGKLQGFQLLRNLGFHNVSVYVKQNTVFYTYDKATNQRIANTGYHQLYEYHFINNLFNIWTAPDRELPDFASYPDKYKHHGERQLGPWLYTQLIPCMIHHGYSSIHFTRENFREIIDFLQLDANFARIIYECFCYTLDYELTILIKGMSRTNKFSLHQPQQNNLPAMGEVPF